MRVIAVDDERHVLADILKSLDEIEFVQAVGGFDSGRACLDYLEEHSVDVALLDIDLGDMSGLVLAKAIKETHPNIRIVFLTGHTEYALDAFKLKVSGYLVKPVDKAEIRKELEYAKNQPLPIEAEARVMIKTFGNFEVLVNGEPIRFLRSKAKELLAYLTDRNGARASLAEIASVLWEDGVYDRSRQKQMQNIVHSLAVSLKEAGAEDIIFKSRLGLALDVSKVDCDYYRFLRGDVGAINTYTGEYMANYWWAEFRIGYLEKHIQYS